MFERNFDETATVALFNLEPYLQCKIDILNWYNL